MLYLIATPIGNLGDISLRALETLRSVDYVASEDTRKTGRMLKHFEIQRPLIAFHEHNEERAGERILDLLLEGNSVAMVTDAGDETVGTAALGPRLQPERTMRDEPKHRARWDAPPATSWALLRAA